MDSEIMRNKKGFIKVQKAFFYDAIDRDRSLLHCIFSRFFCIHIENNGLKDYIIYHGYCDDFREINIGDEIPQYDAVVTRHRNKLYSVEFKEIK